MYTVDIKNTKETSLYARTVIKYNSLPRAFSTFRYINVTLIISVLIFITFVTRDTLRHAIKV